MLLNKYPPLFWISMLLNKYPPLVKILKFFIFPKIT